MTLDGASIIKMLKKRVTKAEMMCLLLFATISAFRNKQTIYQWQSLTSSLEQYSVNLFPEWQRLYQAELFDPIKRKSNNCIQARGEAYKNLISSSHNGFINLGWSIEQFLKDILDDDDRDNEENQDDRKPKQKKCVFKTWPAIRLLVTRCTQRFPKMALSDYHHRWSCWWGQFITSSELVWVMRLPNQRIIAK